MWQLAGNFWKRFLMDCMKMKRLESCCLIDMMHQGRGWITLWWEMKLCSKAGTIYFIVIFKLLVYNMYQELKGGRRPSSRVYFRVFMWLMASCFKNIVIVNYAKLFWRMINWCHNHDHQPYYQLLIKYPFPYVLVLIWHHKFCSSRSGLTKHV